MRTPVKPCRAVLELTEEEDDAFLAALEAHQESREDRVSRQSVLRKLVASFCQSEGIRFPPARPKGVRPRRRTPSQIPQPSTP